MTSPCRRHLTINCDIQRCAEERTGSRRRHASSSDLSNAVADLERLWQRRALSRAERAAADATYRQAAAHQPVPTGHTNHPGALRNWQRRKAVSR